MAQNATQNGATYPRDYDHAGSDHGTPVDALDDLQAGDRILWGDREIPCVVARVVEPEDRIGQSLTASVIPSTPDRSNDPAYTEPEFGRDLQEDDVFINPNSWGALTGQRFALVQGPRGGFYAIAEPARGRDYAALFRAVRSYHKSHLGQPGQGAFKYETDLDGRLTVVEAGDEPAELDPEGDLPAYEEIRENTVVGYHKDAGEHYEVGTVEDVFDEGLFDAHKRAAAEFEDRLSGEEDDEDSGIPPREKVEGTPDGHSFATVTVTEIYEGPTGPRAVVETPAPWDVPDDESAPNDLIKTMPYDEADYKFDSDREAWTLAASELSKMSSIFRHNGYSVQFEDGVLD